MYPIPNTNGKEFWVISDRGMNVDAANANPLTCRPTYDKMFGLPTYAPKIFRVKLNGDSVQILKTISIKRPGGTDATGIMNPTGFGSTATEQASTDTVLNCSKFNLKIAAKDIWGIDAEGIVVDKDGNFWISEEGGPTIWKLNPNGVVISRFTPYAKKVGAQAQDIYIDSCFAYRKNNRGFEGLSITPNGKIYAIIQSPILYPTTTIGEATRVHRMIEIDPTTNTSKMYVYLNDGPVGVGSNQIRFRDWKIGDMAAVNDSTFLLIDHAVRGTTDRKSVYLININGATAVNSGLYGGKTLEALVDSTGLAANGVKPVKKKLFIDLLANGWAAALDKPEGLAIVNDSIIAVCNDNDFGQVCTAQDGIPVPTSILCHIYTYGLKGSNKLKSFRNGPSTGAGPSSSATPYLEGVASGVKTNALITAGDSVKGGYRLAGLPDGLGAYDNGNGTFTVLVNHEMGNTLGAVHAHGSKGAFVSKWVINKSDLAVTSGSDLVTKVKLWRTNTYKDTTTAFNRFCSADLPPVSAFYNAATGLGTQERIFMNGEESGSEGRAFGHIVTGANAGTTYELPYLGKFSWENSIASPYASNKTVVVGTDDATPGQVYFYIGTKTNSGTEIEKAGLNGGKLFGVKVSGLTAESSSSIPSAGTAFTLFDLGQVQNTTGAALNTASNTAGVTTFLRPEDGAWDPSNPNDFYFATTNSFTAPSRLWRLRFTDIANPENGGTITAVLDGTEGPKMIDNIGFDKFGHIMLQEDVGNQAHNGKIWQYTIATDAVKLIAQHDPNRFILGGSSYLTQDEESSGIIDMQDILGAGMFIVADQAHYSVAGDIVEGGQLLTLYNPDTYNSNPEVSVKGNKVNIAKGDITPSTADNTDFGTLNTKTSVNKTFVVKNAGPGALTISAIKFAGTNAAEFSLVSAPTFPKDIIAGDSLIVTVKFAPLADGLRKATLTINNNDADENSYDFALQGTAVSAEINVQGNSVSIASGSTTPNVGNNTDFGTVNKGSNATKSFVIQNTGAGILTVDNLYFTGANASEFTFVGKPTLPLVIAANGSQTITVQFAPTASGVRTATLNVASDDADEFDYTIALQGNGNTSSIKQVVYNNSYVIAPNPFTLNSNVKIDLVSAAKVSIEVFNLLGERVELVVNEAFSAGQYNFSFGSNQNNYPTGIYLVKVVIDGKVSTTKIIKNN